MRKFRSQISLLISAIIFILPMQTSIAMAGVRPVISVLGGITNPRFSSSQNIILLEPFHDTFNATNNDSAEFGGLFAGLETPLINNFLAQFGVSILRSNFFEADGTILQFGNPAFENLGYIQNIRNTTLMAEMRLLYTIHASQNIYPFFIFAAGEGKNETSGYSESPLAGFAVTHPVSFADATTHSFTYAIGIGAEIAATEHVRAGLSYRYANLGNARSGAMPTAASTAVLHYKNIITNEVLASITYAG